MKTVYKHLLLLLSSVRLTPHIALMLFSSTRNLIWADVDRWAQVCGLGKPSQKVSGRVLLFIQLMTLLPEYRTLFYFRTGTWGKLFSILCRPMPFLSLNAKKIGPGLFIQHGWATAVSAEEIGENCWINQHVTIGYTNDVDRPTLGNNVTVHAGAKVLGKVTVGDNSKVGANSVVTADVPPNVTVMGVPARIFWTERSATTPDRIDKSDSDKKG